MLGKLEFDNINEPLLLDVNYRSASVQIEACCLFVSTKIIFKQ